MLQGRQDDQERQNFLIGARENYALVIVTFSNCRNFSALQLQYSDHHVFMSLHLIGDLAQPRM